MSSVEAGHNKSTLSCDNLEFRAVLLELVGLFFYMSYMMASDSFYICIPVMCLYIRV